MKNLDRELVLNHSVLTHYRIVIREDRPFVYLNESSKEYVGYCIDLLKELQRELNFQYDLYRVDGLESIDEDGNWTGMIGELKNNNADIALCSLPTLPEYEKVVDFTEPYFDPIGMSILMLKPDLNIGILKRFFKFSTVMEKGVWLSILITYLCMTFLMWIIDRYSPFSYQNNKDKYRDSSEKRLFSLKECFWFCAISFTPQGGGEPPKSLSGKFITITWWFFIFIVVIAYSANLAAIITIGQLETGVNSMEDLRKQFEIKYSVVINESTYDYFKQMAYIENRFHE